MTKNNVSLVYDGEGNLTSPNLHDAEIMDVTFFDLKNQRNLTLILRTETNEKYEMVLKECRNLSFKGIYHQNIIYKISCSPSNHIIAKLDDYQSEFAIQSDHDKKNIEQDIKDNNLVLIELIPSVGCAILCLCKKMEICQLLQN